MAACAFVLLGCGGILDLDSYKLADDPPAGLGGADASALASPPGSAEGGQPESARGTAFFTAECDACLESSCGPEVAECASDDECRTLKTCLEGCREPGCWLSCSQPGGHSFFSWPLDSLDTCMFSTCVEACRTDGGNFDCAGKWRLPDLYAPDAPIAVDVQVLQALRDTPLSGWTVRACGGTSDCVDSAPPKTTDDFGIGRFELRANRNGRGYEGYFETTDPEPGPDGLRLTYRLWRDDLFNGFWDKPLEFLVDRERVAFQIYEAEMGRPPPADIGALIVTRNFDCHYVPTVGLIAEARPLSGAGVDRPEDILVAYGSPEGTVAIPSYLAIGAPPGRYAITIELRETGEIYRQFEHEIGAGVLDMQSALLPEQIEF